MNWSIHPHKVRADIFRERGKWYETIELDMEDCYNEVNLYDIVLALYQAQHGGLHGMWLVVLEPYHKNAHPVMVRIP